MGIRKYGEKPTSEFTNNTIMPGQPGIIRILRIILDKSVRP